MEIELDMLQRLAPQEEAEDGLCWVTCTYSCANSSSIITCQYTGGVT